MNIITRFLSPITIITSMITIILILFAINKTSQGGEKNQEKLGHGKLEKRPIINKMFDFYKEKNAEYDRDD